MFFALLAMTRIIHIFPGLSDMAVAINETIEKLEKSIDKKSGRSWILDFYQPRSLWFFYHFV